MPRWAKYVSLFLLVAAGFMIATPTSNWLPPPDDAEPADSRPLSISIKPGELLIEGRDGSELQNELVTLAEAMHSGEMTVSGSEVFVRGVASRSRNWATTLDAFRQRLPAETDLVQDVLIVDDELDVHTLCRRMFDTIRNADVTFRQSGSKLRTASFAALDRMISFASSCVEVTILIVGHSDTSGDEEFNRILSLRRAEAVAEYLRAGGVPAEQLRVDGRGSSEPVADNDTVHGRARNRRIEFDLLSAS